MAQEIHDGSATAPGGAATSADLSNHVFSDPQDFLSTLKNNYSKIAQSDPSAIYKSDLILYADHGSDPRTKAAAEIALKHFDDLQAMPYAAAGWTNSKKEISPLDLKVDLQLMDKDSSAVEENHHFDRIYFEATYGLMAGIFGVGALASAEFPPLAIGFGALAAGGLYGIHNVSQDFDKQNQNAIDTMQKNIPTIKSWL